MTPDEAETIKALPDTSYWLDATITVRIYLDDEPEDLDGEVEGIEQDISMVLDGYGTEARNYSVQGVAVDEDVRSAPIAFPAEWQAIRDGNTP